MICATKGRWISLLVEHFELNHRPLTEALHHLYRHAGDRLGLKLKAPPKLSLVCSISQQAKLHPSEFSFHST